MKCDLVRTQGDDGSGGVEENRESSAALAQPTAANDLRKMLCETDEPVIGLHYVEELMPETNRDSYPPHYACGLCNVAAAPASGDDGKLNEAFSAYENRQTVGNSQNFHCKRSVTLHPMLFGKRRFSLGPKSVTVALQGSAKGGP